MSCKESRLEVLLVHLLVPLKNVRVFDRAYAEAATHANDGIVAIVSLLSLGKEFRNLILHGDLVLYEDIRICLSIRVDVKRHDTVATLLECTHHGAT